MASYANLFQNEQKMGDLGPGEFSRKLLSDSSVSDDALRYSLDNYKTAGKEGSNGFQSESVDWNQGENRFTTATDKVPEQYKNNWVDIGDGRSYFSRGGSAASAPNSPASLKEDATEARERAVVATKTMRDTMPQVTYNPSQPNAGTDSAMQYGNDVRKWMGSFVDSLNANAGQEAAENKQTMLGAIRALPTSLRLPQPVNTAALYDKYSSALG